MMSYRGNMFSLTAVLRITLTTEIINVFPWVLPLTLRQQRSLPTMNIRSTVGSVDS
jgi:hypothetical protein